MVESKQIPEVEGIIDSYVVKEENIMNMTKPVNIEYPTTKTPPPSEAFRSLPRSFETMPTLDLDYQPQLSSLSTNTPKEEVSKAPSPEPFLSDPYEINTDSMPHIICDPDTVVKSTNITSETLVETSSNETSDQSKSTTTDGELCVDDKEEEQAQESYPEKKKEENGTEEANGTRSISSQNKYLVPRRYSDDSSHNSKKIMEVDLAGHPGSRSPSVLSSQEDYSSKDSEEIEKDMLRMKHLGFLLEQHQRRLTEDGDVWASDLGSSNVSSENSNNMDGDKESESTNMNRGGEVNKSLYSADGSYSTVGSFITKKDSSSSLFDNYDKTWSSIHQIKGYPTPDDVNSAKLLSLERLCFATAVHMLMKDYKQERNTTSSWGAIPVEIVQLFWKEVILLDVKEDSVESRHLDGIVKTLTEKLRYMTIKVIDNGYRMLSLSHEVYAQYARYILECDSISQQQIDQWNMVFAGVLQNDILLKQSSIGTKAQSVVERYAVTTLPTILVNAMTPIFTDTPLAKHTVCRESYEKECLSVLVVLLQNKQFLVSRMKVLGSKVSETLLSNEVQYDVVQATTIHLKDLETVASVISRKTDYVMVGDDAYGITRAVVTIYNSWKDSCYIELEKRRSLGRDKNGKNSASNELNLSESLPPLHRRFKKAAANSMLMPYSQACLTWKPKQLLPSSSEYELISASSDIRALPNGTSRGKRRPSNRGLGKPAEEDRPTMPLSDVLRIDVDILSFEMSVAKALYLLGESLASISSSKSLCFNRPTGRTFGLLLTGPMACTSKLNHCASALEVYLRVANVTGFLLSDELRNVDEDDLVDLGFNYEDVNGMDPSTRMKILIKDREVASELMRQLDILIAESFFALGNHLLCGIQLGQADVIDMAGISLLNNLVEPSISSSLATEIEKKPSDKEKILQCYQLSMQFLNLGVPMSKDEIDVEGTYLGLEIPDENYETELDMVKIHQRTLHTAVLHAIGIHYYEQIGNFDLAKRYLDDCISKRQLLLRHLRDDEGDSGNISSSSAGSVPIKARRNRSYNYKLDGSYQMSESSVASTRRGRRSSNRRSGSHRSIGRRSSNNRRRGSIGPQGLWNEVSNTIFLVFGNRRTKKECISSIELDLSSTMEFSALATHGLSDSESALALFQEALLLRALHSGKNSLEVADLQYNMGVIHDDLGQYEASLGRYGESLRVRHSQLEQLNIQCSSTNVGSGTLDEIEDIEASVVLTLRCMINVYHALKDFHNAISTNLKAIELLKTQLKRKGSIVNNGIYSQQGSILGFGKMIGGNYRVPLPKLIFDEYRSAVSKNILPTSSDQPNGPSREIEKYEGDEARNEIYSMYVHIVSLLEEIKDQEGQNGNTSSGYNSSTSSSARSFLADHHSMANLVGTRHINREHVQIESSFNLGLISMYFGEHKKAIDFIEQALRTLWTAFPGDSSESESDASSSNKSADSSAEMRLKARKIYVEGQAEEGILYHALALSHAALSDNERAIRCYITALRYYRKRFGKLSMVVSGALYDCATSYWNLCDFGKAEDFWADCLRILLSQERGDEKEFANMIEIDIGRTLYNIAASKVCKGDYINKYTTTCLHDALSIFKKNSHSGEFSEEVAHAYFNLGLVHYHRFIRRRGLKQSIHEDEESKSCSGDVSCSTTEELNLAMTCIDDALNAYLSGVTSTEIISQAAVGQNLQHPMQALVSLVTGLINCASGSVTQATWNFKTAIRLLNKVYSPKNLYSASALDNLGDLLIAIGATEEALKNYEECLSIRISILGRTDVSVGNSLFKISGIHLNALKYDQALTMQRECLQIRMELEGSDGDGVATMLFNIGLLHSRKGDLRKSQEYLEGALKVRKSRIVSMTTNTAVKENGSETKAKDLDKIETADDNTVVKALELHSEECGLASILHNMGNIHLKMENAEAAMPLYEEALNYWNKLCEFGEGGFSEYVRRKSSEEKFEAHKERLRDMADTLHNMGGVYETRLNFSRALSCYNQALVMKRYLLIDKSKDVGGRSQPMVVDEYISSSKTLSSAITLLRIGAIHVILQNYDVSLSYYKSALRIQRQHLGREHIAVAQTLYEIGVTLRQMIKYSPNMRALDIMNMEKAAVKYFKDSLKIAQNRYGSNHEVVASVMYDIGSIHDCKGDYQEAISCYKHSVRVYGNVYGRTLCKELFDISQNDSSLRLNIDDMHGLFHPTGQNGFITNPFLDSSRNNTSSPKRHLTLNEKGRDAYLKASLSLANAAAQSGIIGTTSSIEIKLLQVIHYIVVYGVDPAKASLKKIIESIFGLVRTTQAAN